MQPEDDPAMTAEPDRRTEGGGWRSVEDEFIATLSHELRGPLAPIVHALQAMRLKGLATDEQSVIERQVGRLQRMVDDLFDGCRIASGKVVLSKQRIELAEIVRAAVEVVAPSIEARRQALSVDVAPGLVVEADVDRMTQVVANLLSNAAKYSEPSGSISVTARRTDAYVRLTVADGGIGIEPERLAHIFDAFVQGPRRTGCGGLGLGLTIVKRLVALHGGKVEARSQGAGRGSEFSIELPCLAPPKALRRREALRPVFGRRGPPMVGGVPGSER